jgi:hypothetical protein
VTLVTKRTLYPDRAHGVRQPAHEGVTDRDQENTK